MMLMRMKMMKMTEVGPRLPAPCPNSHGHRAFPSIFCRPLFRSRHHGRAGSRLGAHIAQVAGVWYLVHILTPDVWLTRGADEGTPLPSGTFSGRWEVAMEAAAREFGHERASIPPHAVPIASRVHDPPEYAEAFL